MLIDIAKKVLSIEAEAIIALKNRLNGDFTKIIELLYNCKGRVIVSGLGKSGIIGNKFSASLSSTGTPSFFLHSSEAVHGGLGILSEGDVLVTLSYSGESNELEKIISHCKRKNIKILTITGHFNSKIARLSDYIFDVNVRTEASDSIPYLPTASTTVMLAICDAITVALLEKKGFYEKDFALIHPGGAIGKRFAMVNDLMHIGNEIPLVDISSTIYEVMKEITDKNFGLTGVLKNGQLVGVITDADIRRALIKMPSIDGIKALDVMSKNPKVIVKSEVALKAIGLFEKHTITSLFVVEKKDNSKVVGYIHIKDLLKAKVL